MDTSDSIVVSYIGLVISIGSIVIGYINHRRIRSTCCGHNGDVSIDIESTTPNRATPLLGGGSLPLKSAPSPPSAPGNASTSHPHQVHPPHLP